MALRSCASEASEVVAAAVEPSRANLVPFRWLPYTCDSMSSSIGNIGSIGISIGISFGISIGSIIAWFLSDSCRALVTALVVVLVVFVVLLVVSLCGPFQMAAVHLCRQQQKY